jgi:hypothetical protein
LHATATGFAVGTVDVVLGSNVLVVELGLRKWRLNTMKSTNTAAMLSIFRALFTD